MTNYKTRQKKQPSTRKLFFMVLEGTTDRPVDARAAPLNCFRT